MEIEVDFMLQNGRTLQDGNIAELAVALEGLSERLTDSSTQNTEGSCASTFLFDSLSNFIS